jgi:membrane protease YdiL (CAAX protease family)
VLLFGIAYVVPGMVQVFGVMFSTGLDAYHYVYAPTPVLLVWTVLAALMSIGLYGGAVMLAERRDPTEIALHPALIELAAGLAIGALMMAITVAVLWATGCVTIATRALGDPTRAIAMSIQSGVLEETAFRLVVFRLLWRAFGVWAALALSALLFGVMHLPNPNATWFSALCIAVEAGIMLAGFYILTGRVWSAIGVHAAWNFTQGWVMGAAVSGTDWFDGGPLNVEPTPGVSEFLSGGQFGPEASVAGLFVGTAVGALTLYLARQRGRLRAVDDQAFQDPSAMRAGRSRAASTGS